MTIKLMSTGLDGELLHDDGTYNEEKFADILEQLDDLDIKLAITTRSNYSYLKHKLFPKFWNKLIFITEDGALTYIDDSKTDTNSITKRNTAQFIKVLAEYQDNIDWLNYLAVSTETQYYYYSKKQVHFEKTPEGKSLINLEDLSKVKASTFKEIPFRIIFNANSEKIDQMTLNGLVHKLETEFDLSSINYQGNDLNNTFEFLSKGVNKATALQKIIKKHNIDAENEVVTFGNDINDKELLYLTRFAFAMNNRQEAVNNITPYITIKNNENDGVLDMMQRFISEERNRRLKQMQDEEGIPVVKPEDEVIKEDLNKSKTKTTKTTKAGKKTKTTTKKSTSNSKSTAKKTTTKKTSTKTATKKTKSTKSSKSSSKSNSKTSSTKKTNKDN